MFSLRRHVAAGVRVALGSDVGAGTGFSIFKEGLQAYFLQHLLGEEGMRLTAAHLLHLSTAAGAAALGLADTVGDLSVGKQFDAILVRPPAGTALDIGLRHAESPEAALGKVFALAGTVDDDARRLFVECALGEDFPDFLTLQAYDVLLARGD